MGRGQGKATDLGNNAPAYQPWTWEVESSLNEEPEYYKSTRHELRVVKDGRYFKIAKNGRYERGSRRVRTFKSVSAAQLAADFLAGVA